MQASVAPATADFETTSGTDRLLDSVAANDRGNDDAETSETNTSTQVISTAATPQDRQPSVLPDDYEPGCLIACPVCLIATLMLGLGAYWWVIQGLDLDPNAKLVDTGAIFLNALYLLLCIVGLSLLSGGLHHYFKEKVPTIADLLFLLFTPYQYSWKNLLGHGVCTSLLFLIFHLALIVDLALSPYGNLSGILGVALMTMYALLWHCKTQEFITSVLGDEDTV